MSSAEYQRAWRAERARQAGREPGQQGRPTEQPCGTVSAYRRHRSHGETPCEACREAYAEKHREYYRRRKAQ